MPLQPLHHRLRAHIHQFHDAIAPDGHELRLRRKGERRYCNTRHALWQNLRHFHDLLLHRALRRLRTRINPLHKRLNLRRREFVAFARRHEFLLPVLHHLAAQIFHHQALRPLPRFERLAALAAFQNIRVRLHHKLPIRIVRRVTVETAILDQLGHRREIIRLLRKQTRSEKQ